MSMPPRILALALGVVFFHGSAAGQTFVEVRGGFTVGSHSGTAAGLDFAPAPSFQALAVRQVTPLLSVYGGYVRTAFGCEEGFCLDRDLTVTGNHGVVGAEARKDWAWLRLGVLLGKTEVGTEGDAPDLGPGIHFGAGASLGSGRLRFLPGLSYRWLSAKTSSSSDHAVAVGVDLGVGIRLGPSLDGGR
jgi:hypothetical protein